MAFSRNTKSPESPFLRTAEFIRFKQCVDRFVLLVYESGIERCQWWLGIDSDTNVLIVRRAVDCCIKSPAGWFRLQLRGFPFSILSLIVASKADRGSVCRVEELNGSPNK